MSVRDPRGDKTGLRSINPQTGTQSVGGFIDMAAIDLGNGTGALAVIAVQRETSEAGPFASSQPLIGADVSRLALTIVNTDPSENLYIGLNGAAAVAGTNTVLPGGVFNVPANDVAGVVNGIWDGGATAGATMLATTG